MNITDFYHSDCYSKKTVHST